MEKDASIQGHCGKPEAPEEYDPALQELAATDRKAAE